MQFGLDGLGGGLCRLPLFVQLLYLRLGLLVALGRALDPAGTRPSRRVGELVLEFAQLRLGPLDPLLQLRRLARRFLGRLGGAVPLAASPVRLRRRARLRLALVAPPLVLGPAA